MAHWIKLHDHLNPDQEVDVEADDVSVISLFGSGSALFTNEGTVAVHETPAEVMALIKAARNNPHDARNTSSKGGSHGRKRNQARSSTPHQH